MRLVIASHKGGVGKSTISLNLAVALARLGYRTALVDTDPQGALNLSLAKGHMEYPGLADVLSKKSTIDEVVLQTKLPNLSLLTKGRLSTVQIPHYEKLIFQTDGLAELTADLETSHEVVLFDTPAGLGMITRAVMQVASHILVPMKLDALNLRSVNQILQVIASVQNNENPDLGFLGLVMNMFDRKDPRSYQLAGEVWQAYPTVLETTIPDNTIFVEANDKGVPLALLGRREHPEAKRFADLAREILAMVNPMEEVHDEIRQLL